MNKRKTPVTLVVVIILLSCCAVMATATAQTSQSTQPPIFNGTPPSGWNGNMTMPPPDFNGSSGFGNGGMPMPDFNGTMPSALGNPGDLNGQLNPQASGNQTNYTLYAIAGVVAVVIVVAVIAVMLVRKRKPRQPVPIASQQSTGNNSDVSL